MVEGVIARAIETVIPAMSKESKVLHVVNSGSQSHGNNAEGGKRIKEIFPDSQNVTTLDGDTAGKMSLAVLADTYSFELFFLLLVRSTRTANRKRNI